MRVLLVEDTDDLRYLLARALRLYGCEVREAESAGAALEAVAGFQPDLVVTDIMMPVMDGVELIRRLRSSPATSTVPMVAITADSTGRAERRAREAGAVDFIIKPVDVVMLLARWESYRKVIDAGW